MFLLRQIFIGIIFYVGTPIFAQTTIPRASYQQLFTSSSEFALIYQSYQFAKPQTIGDFFYVLYKKNFSFLDVNSCNFSPSCSTYGLATIKKHGFFIGILDTFDRLTRCHPKANHGKYQYDPHSHLLIDYP